MAKLKINPENMTFGDLEEFEELNGVSLMSVFQGDGNWMSRLTSKQLTQVIWFAGRAENPDFTVEDAKKVRMGDIDLSEPDPTDGSGTDS